MNAPSPPLPSIGRETGRSAFGSDARGYHEARSGYPDALFRELSRRASPTPRILEIGAGTGHASAGLLACDPSHLTLIEPDPRLCAHLGDMFADSRVSICNGVFPDIAIEGPFDLIACAAAFHWMEPRSALARIKALLAPGGVWAMWWNCYLAHGEDDPLADRALALLEADGVALPPSFRPEDHYALNAAAQVAMLEEAGFGGIEQRRFRAVRALDRQQVRALYASFSFLSILPAPQRERILDRIGRFVSDDLGGSANCVVVTALYIAAA